MPLLLALLLAAPADDYAPVAAKRAAEAVEAAGPLDPAKADRARKAVAAHYVGLNDIHTARDAAVKAAASDKGAVAAAKAKADAAVKGIHAKFLAELAAALTPEQADAVKDKMTYNVVPITAKAYREMLPKLTDAQAARIRELLIAGREEALVAGASKAKHERFGAAKGRINNYLSAEGYDLKKAGEEWAERRKADAAKKDGK